MKLISLLIIFISINGMASPCDTIPTDDKDAPIFQKVETSPEFPGGLMGWRKFVTDSLRAEIPVDNGAPDGVYTVVVQFIVQKDGTLTDIKALTKHGFGMESEVLRIMGSSPKWIPARQNGRIVRAYMKQPVSFVVSEE